MIPAGFIRVTRRLRCPICGRPDWCLVSVDGERAVCKRQSSEIRWKDAGWLHHVRNGQRVSVASLPKHREPAALSSPELANMQRRFEADVPMDRLIALASSLGVSQDSLDRIGVGFWAERGHWTFPMFRADGQVAGFRVRTESGSKFSVAGGSEGLFIPQNLPETGDLLICEGPTSLAALLDMGFAAIGRPSCDGAVATTAEWLRSHPRRDATIFADKDSARRPDGSVFHPGIDGAKRLAESIRTVCRTLRIIQHTQHKDPRVVLQRVSNPRPSILLLMRNARPLREPVRH